MIIIYVVIKIFKLKNPYFHSPIINENQSLKIRRFTILDHLLTKWKHAIICKNKLKVLPHIQFCFLNF
jgi:hypothetical protein